MTYQANNVSTSPFAPHSGSVGTSTTLQAEDVPDPPRAKSPDIPAYTYTALQAENEIRLLRLAPRLENPDTDALTATINHVHLGDSPLYTAVSWLWGLPKDLVELNIGGRSLWIQANLGWIMRHLQHDNKSRNLWIDAVCIDQSNMGERGHQVRLMGDIYRNANEVVACLMAKDYHAPVKIAAAATGLHNAFSGFLSDGRKIDSSAPYQILLEHPYFTRRWIIQEILLARSVILCCEGHQIPMSALECLQSTEGKALRIYRSWQVQDRGASSLYQLLYTHKSAQCTEIHDKVYALLSLTEHARDKLPVRYDIGRMNLMASVLLVSWQHENLLPEQVLGFAGFLIKNLRIRNEQVQRAITYPIPSMSAMRFRLQGVVRGTVKTRRMSPEIENAALQVRDQSPSLACFGEVELKSTCRPLPDGVNLLVASSPLRQHHFASTISPAPQSQHLTSISLHFRAKTREPRPHRQNNPTSQQPT